MPKILPRWSTILFPLSLLVVACEQAPSMSLGPEPHSAADPEREPARRAQGLVVHEWGTYTSLQSSNGQSMEGLHHTEELLPAFVYARDYTSPFSKGVGPSLPEPVTQKLETPVLYFYDDADQYDRIDVAVEFPQGIVSEWFPQAASFEPPLDQLPAMARGSMSWSVELFDGEPAAPFVSEESVWAPSRRVAAKALRVGREEERFIFYRGLGRFEMPLRVSDGSLGIQIFNGSIDSIPNVFVLDVDEEGGSVLELGALRPGGTHLLEKRASKKPMRAYVDEAAGQVAAALEQTGLFADEAKAMVDTWRHSYFQTPGLRVLYIAPRAWTDSLLPIRISPEPVELVRTLVGRVEVLTTAEEASIVRDIEMAYSGEKAIDSNTYGRFTEPKLRRAAELIQDPNLAAYTEGLVGQAAQAP